MSAAAVAEESSVAAEEDEAADEAAEDDAEDEAADVAAVVAAADVAPLVAVGEDVTAPEVAAETEAETAEAVCVLGIREVALVTPMTEIAALLVTEGLAAAAADVAELPAAAAADVAAELASLETDGEVVLLVDGVPFVAPVEPLLVLAVVPFDPLPVSAVVPVDPLLEPVVVPLVDESTATVQVFTSWTAGCPLASVTGVKVIMQVCVRGPDGVMELVTVITVVGSDSWAAAAEEAACRFARGKA